jgi:hypothetical protein
VPEGSRNSSTWGSSSCGIRPELPLHKITSLVVTLTQIIESHVPVICRLRKCCRRGIRICTTHSRSCACLAEEELLTAAHHLGIYQVVVVIFIGHDWHSPSTDALCITQWIILRGWLWHDWLMLAACTWGCTWLLYQLNERRLVLRLIVEVHTVACARGGCVHLGLR